VLWDQLMCWCSHHPLVLNGILFTSWHILQSKLVSAIPNTLNSHLHRPCLIISSLNLVLFFGKPPMFWKPILRILSCFVVIKSPKCSSPKESFCLAPTSSAPRLLSEDVGPVLLTMASGSSGVAGLLSLRGVSHFRLS